MEPTQWLSFYLTYFILIGLSHGRALKGQNVRNATSSDNLSFVVHILEIRQSSMRFCTGTLITRWSILTAAHCIVGGNKNDIQIRIGSTDLCLARKYDVASWKIFNQGYHNTTKEGYTDNDIAIITLAKRVSDANMQPASISYTAVENLHCTKVRIAGWGRRNDDKVARVLKTGVVKVVSLRDCLNRMKQLLGMKYPFSNDYFCSAADPWLLAAEGDSGAPILNKQNQVIAIHIGNCRVQNDHTKDFKPENLMNFHLLLLRYRKFIKDSAVV